LSSSKNQLLSGTATMSWDDGVPLAVISNGSNELNVELATALQVELPASQDGKYAEYYIPIVPTEFMENDFTFIITWADGTTYTKTVASPFKVGRKMIKGVRHTIGTSFEGVTEDAEEVWNGESTEEITPDENGVYNITKPAQLAYLASRGALSVNDNNVETVTINLQKNLDMGNGTVSALIAQRGDVLTFNGNGYTISNVNIVSGNGDNTTGQAGLFYCFPNSKLNVSDLNLENIAVTADENSTGYAAAIVGYCEGTTVLNNVNVMNANVRGTKSSGMLAGHMSGSLTAMNCKVGGDVTLVDFETGGHYAGEYVGTVAGSVALTACTENVTVGGNLKDINVGKFYGRIASGALVIDGATVVATTDALATAVASGLTDLYLMPGEYKNISGCAGKTLTFNGTEEAILKLMNQGEDGCDYAFGSASAGVGNVTFNGLTIDTSENTGNYKGYAYMKGTFNRCSFIGAYSLNNANAFVFNNCVFDFKNGYFWTWGANQVTFDGCEFYGNSKTILAHGGASTIINIKDCKFNATEKGYTGTGDNTACVEIDPTGTNAYTVNFMGNNTINDNYAGWIRIKDGSIGHIITGLE